MSLTDNLVLSRRLQLNNKNRSLFLDLKEGDTFKDASFSSFSLRQLGMFGNDFQITLLAKKGEKVAWAGGEHEQDEMEYLAQRNTTFKVLAKGYNSIVVEIVDQNTEENGKK